MKYCGQTEQYPSQYASDLSEPLILSFVVPLVVVVSHNGENVQGSHQHGRAKNDRRASFEHKNMRFDREYDLREPQTIDRICCDCKRLEKVAPAQGPRNVIRIVNLAGGARARFTYQ